MPTQTFTTSGSWTFPANYLAGSLVVDAWGEGGAGAAGASIHHGGAGGGGGEYAQDTPDGTAGSTVLTITIGTGGSGTNTTVTGSTNGKDVTANAGGSGSGQAGTGAGGSGSTNATHNNGGGGGTGGGASSGNEGGGGGGGSGGNGGTGGSGTAGGTFSGGSAGTAGSGTPGGASGGGGGAPGATAGSNGTAPGGGGGGGGAGNFTTGAGGSGAAGQVTLTWSVVVYVTPQVASPRQRYSPAVSALLIARRRETAHPITQPVPEKIWITPRFPQISASRLVRRDKGASPTGWPVPVQPPEIPSSEHARFKPPYPRKGVTETAWPNYNVPPTESYRARFKPPWPRRGVVAPTGWPVPVQPPWVPNTGVVSHGRTRRRRTVRGEMGWPFTPAVLVQPPWSSWVYKRRWSKPLLPRKGVVPPEGLPPPPPSTPYNPTYERRPQRYQWYRRGNVPPTGWPIPVQPPMIPGPYGIRRYSKPLWPRKSAYGYTTPLNQPPVPVYERRLQKYQWFRRGNAQPNTGLPVPVQPKELPHSVRPMSRFVLRRRGNVPPGAGPYFMPVQPPERMQSVRRWSRPLFPRKSTIEIATLAGPQLRIGYQPLTVQTFTYTPGGAGMDLTLTNLLLFQLNSNGFSFWNQYGDVIFVLYNNTPLDVTIQPNVVRTIELQSIQISATVLHPGAIQALGPFPPGDFTDLSLGYIMTIAVQANSSGVYAGAFRMVPAPPIGHTGQYDLLGGRLRRLTELAERKHNSSPGEIYPGDTTPGA